MENVDKELEELKAPGHDFRHDPEEIVVEAKEAEHFYLITTQDDQGHPAKVRLVPPPPLPPTEDGL